ncbi:SHOCT domain-containing protein [Streptomyces sp. NPDC001339]|uniref:SHOCT domain-containing protein n=1 Tax=Streptomyces sp. NPDC001339 TaxID=3364563 RepID=UPI0036AF9BA2
MMLWDGHWGGYDHGGWGWFAMSISMLLFLALIVLVVLLFFRAFSRGGSAAFWERPAPPGAPGPGRANAEQILAERFARGEIDEEEYHRRLATLRGSPPGT